MSAHDARGSVRRRLLLAAAGVCGGIDAAPAVAAGSPVAPRADAPFAFGLVGDTGYTGLEERAFDDVLAAMDRDTLAFVLHVGDIKSGGSACTDALLAERIGQLDRSAHPLVYTPGDNEWTDCHRAFDGPASRRAQWPGDRLARLRALAFARPESLGRRPMPLQRQSAAMPENQRWQVGSLLCATVHVVGSRDGLGDDAGARDAWQRRSQANVQWLQALVRHAKQAGPARVRGLLVALHADMGLQRRGGPLPPWQPVCDALVALARDFGGPVLLAHGDSHVFRVDRPFARSHGVANLVRVICFGSPFASSWVRIRFDPAGRADADDADHAAFFVAVRGPSDGGDRSDGGGPFDGGGAADSDGAAAGTPSPVAEFR